MSVKIVFDGRFGNHLFRYISARLYAEKHQLNLLSTMDTLGVMQLKPPNIYHNDNLSNFQTKKITRDDIDENNNIKYYGKMNYIFEDYFQNTYLYMFNKEQIKNYFIFDDKKYSSKNTEDLVIHIRIDDFILPGNYKSSECIHPNSYTKILDELQGTYKLLYIVTEKPKAKWEFEYLSYFDKYNPIIISESIADDFNFIRNFNKIISSNSTFSYWAAFFSDAEEIYSFNQMGYYENHIPQLVCHGNHIKDIHRITDKCKSYDATFYRNEKNKL
jgi:hypothetical protein